MTRGARPGPAPLTPDAPLAVALGDPSGVGPELIVAAWAALQSDKSLSHPFFVVGGMEILRAAADARGIDCPLVPIAQSAEAPLAWSAGLPVMAGIDVEYTPGTPSPDGARVALSSLEWATDLALRGDVAGIVTAPVAKTELSAIGFEHPGQTEFLASTCGRRSHDAVMMLAGPSLRTVPVTVHCALADVPRRLTPELIIHKAVITHIALARDFGLAKPRLAVAALNPHAGENGQFGDEEERIIAPAISALKAEGLDVIGPVPGDALFMPRARSGYDAAVCMYHDQALIPLKALEVDDGVNVTLGLPIVRTSPDHGTAFDIAGKRLADPGAMIAAIRMASACATQRAAIPAHE
ncbi:MAG: 4-hydroxythreonine-4-phosphate dehydrogenase PdxA [Erythrobacter sp.]|uniref:4-hydroxythreonine-4-phosphate dehydrogenase PdxA n=1 Tax=Erythrobacter sp. TaxID=1042 RepID=UPI0026366C02|nr:4-hydroxythreonine-4-phosphate dehydrogenase PdxA [Erythrobacter sp.]MDJ0978769.1 4-hydroxythreonine-4-phosphate dehydrogenase PdxA [Erythrobacter sp.]